MTAPNVDPQLDRDSVAAEYFSLLPFSPYPVQEEALLAYYTEPQGVLVCAPTGTGKTLIAEAAVYEALRTGKRCYYTTPLIALTDQKLDELQQSAVRWGFPAHSVGLVTGNRRVNPEAPVLVVVAEILLNRLLHPEAFDFADVSSVVMDEFHSFNDRERGIVWELTLAFLPRHVRTLLLSATVGNAVEFVSWLERQHGRNLKLVTGTERKVPLAFEYVEDRLLEEQLEWMFEGDAETRRTPTLLFCFNRQQCWQIAEMLRGKKLVSKTGQAALIEELDKHDLSQGAGPKLKSILQRGVGIHHAGILPVYRRLVERLFQAKLLSVTVCTETLSAGINLPARSVVLPTIVKGPREKKRLIETATAQQIFGRAGRPQYDREGFVYALAHEDDVKLYRWRLKYDSIPEDTKDPGLLRAKKQLKKKMPKRREGETYWTASQFDALRTAPAARLQSQGDLPWRLLAFMLLHDSNVQPLRELVRRRLLNDADSQNALRRLNQMLVTLWQGKFIKLEPPPPQTQGEEDLPPLQLPPAKGSDQQKPDAVSPKNMTQKVTNSGGLFSGVDLSGLQLSNDDAAGKEAGSKTDLAGDDDDDLGSDDLIAGSDSQSDGENRQSSSNGSRIPPNRDESADEAAEDDDEESQLPTVGMDRKSYRRFDLEGYVPQRAEGTTELPLLLRLRSINPLYGMYLADWIYHGDATERIQAIESILELPGNVAKSVRVPPPEELPFGPLALQTLHPRLLQLGLATPSELMGRYDDDDDEPDRSYMGRRPPPPRPLSLGEKIHRLFEHDVPGVYDVRVQGVWVVGELLEFNGEFFKYILARKLQKEEGIIFRHVLRFIMLCDEMASIAPQNSQPEQWEDFWDDLIVRLSDCCRAVDPESTAEVLDNKLESDELLIDQPRQFRRS